MGELGNLAVELELRRIMHRSEKVRIFRKWLMILGIAGVSCGILLTTAQTVTDLLRGADPFQPTVFTEFFACAGPDPLTGKPQKPVSIFSCDADAVYVCGYLQAGGSVWLRFVPIYDGKPQGRSILGEYQPGYIFVEILKSQRKTPGHYRVEVHKGRTKLATTEFTIVP
jgi:hypothetical protein